MTKNELLIELILQILEDPRISGRLYDIANNNYWTDERSYMQSKSENSELFQHGVGKNGELLQNTVIRECERKIDVLSRKLRESNDEIGRIKEEIELIKQKKKYFEQENELYDNSFCNFKKVFGVYQMYGNLPEELRSRNLSFISEKSLFAFVVTGVKHLERFWEFIKEELLANRFEYTESLKDVFGVFFDIQDDMEKLYIRNECRLGDRYNVNKHIMMPGGKELGAISEILFLGFSDGNGKIIKKSIVRVTAD